MKLPITLDIPDAIAAEVLAAFKAFYGFEPDSGMTDKEFVVARVREFFKEPWARKVQTNAQLKAATEARAAIDAITIVAS